MTAHRSFRLPEPVVAYLDSLPRGARSGFVVNALETAIAQATTAKEQLLIERDRKLQLLQQLEAELRFIDTRLSDFDSDAEREALLARRIEVRLRGGTEWKPSSPASVRAWQLWAGDDWPVVERLLQHQEARP